MRLFKNQLCQWFTILFLICSYSTTVAIENITIDAGTVNGIIPAIHGTDNGPAISKESNPPCGVGQPGNHSDHYVYANIPMARNPGSGALNISSIWKPWPKYNGFDASDPNNYDWKIADQAMDAATKVTEVLFRFGESANHGISSGGGCDPTRPTSTPPENFAIFGQVTKHIMKHYLDGWDNGFYYNVQYAEVWNEFYIPDFWTGTGKQAAQLFEAVYDAIKPDFPALQIGASISLQYTQSGFMDYVRKNNMTLDFVSPHSYRAMPYVMKDVVYNNPGNDWESVFAAYGLPINTPIMFTEWNRPGGCYNGGDQGGLSAIPIAAHLIGTLIEMAKMHPSNGSHNVIMGNYFSAGKQIWDRDNNNRSAGTALDAYGHDLFGETPLKLALTGEHSNYKDIDFSSMAGKSENNDKLNVLVSYYQTTQTTCPLVAGATQTLNLNINNLPWGNGQFTWERWVHTSTSSMSLEDSGTGSGGSFTTTQTMNENVFELYKFSRAANTSPSFTTSPILKNDAKVDATYSASIATTATDSDLDNLSYSKVSGASWLTISADGDLSGIPTSSDVGVNSWNIEVTDGQGGKDTAILRISVDQKGDEVPRSSGGAVSWLGLVLLLFLMLLKKLFFRIVKSITE